VARPPNTKKWYGGQNCLANRRFGDRENASPTGCAAVRLDHTQAAFVARPVPPDRLPRREPPGWAVWFWAASIPSVGPATTLGDVGSLAGGRRPRADRSGKERRGPHFEPWLDCTRLNGANENAPSWPQGVGRFGGGDDLVGSSCRERFAGALCQRVGRRGQSVKSLTASTVHLGSAARNSRTSASPTPESFISSSSRVEIRWRCSTARLSRRVPERFSDLRRG
jgi:hypothetical protein